MQFRAPAPGNLTQLGSSLFGDWAVADGNFGYAKADVEAWVSGALNDARGWEQCGVTFRHFSSIPAGSPGVVFHVVETITGGGAGPGTIGMTYWNSPVTPYLIELEAANFGQPDLVNHEAAHGFFGAIHSPEGTDSIMEPIDEVLSTEWPSATDLAQVSAWISGAGAETTYWFPGDLPYYITKWIVPEGSKCRLVVPVLAPAPVLMRAVCNSDLTAMLQREYQPFGIGVATSAEGFWVGEWVDAPPGELYVGIIVEGATPAEFQDLAVGLAQVQLASPSATGGGSPIGN